MNGPKELIPIDSSTAIYLMWNEELRVEAAMPPAGYIREGRYFHCLTVRRTEKTDIFLAPNVTTSGLQRASPGGAARAVWRATASLAHCAVACPPTTATDRRA